MGKGGIRIEVSNLDFWVKGLTAAEVGPGAVAVWSAAVDVWFSKTQQYVHVISGDLKSSGEQDVTLHGRVIEGALTYSGGPDRSYAVYEIRRGGAHDFLTRGFVATQKIFQRALVDAMEGMVVNVIGGTGRRR